MPQEEKSVEKEAALPKQSDWDISPKQLKTMMEKGEKFQLIDVREPHEFQICNLKGELIPLAQLPGKLGSLNKDAHIVVHCRSGGRSAKAVTAMRQQGFKNVWNMAGGTLAWSDMIDPSMPKY
jgi:adenylyltransferase/sulfurtransferase